MSGDTRIGLAIVRNNLYNGRFGAPDDQSLRELTAVIDNSSTPFRTLMLHMIANARADIAAQRLKEAGFEINAIHNLPVQTADFRGWDRKWFQEGEVPSYIERVSPARGARFLELAAEAQLRYDEIALAEVHE